LLAASGFFNQRLAALGVNAQELEGDRPAESPKE
jgi:hypothetical protein